MRHQIGDHLNMEDTMRNTPKGLDREPIAYNLSDFWFDANDGWTEERIDASVWAMDFFSFEEVSR
jgi:hypothetical protein